MTAAKTLRVIIDAAVREIVTIIRVAGRLDPASIEKIYQAISKALAEARKLEREERFAPFREADEDADTEPSATTTARGYRRPSKG